jgi:hypothetical protein
MRPAWRKDGRELYYESDGKLMAVPVRSAPTFDPGAPAALFETQAANVPEFGLGWNYDVAPDGRFLVNRLIDRTLPPMNVVLNWTTEIGKNLSR